MAGDADDAERLRECSTPEARRELLGRLVAEHYDTLRKAIEVRLDHFLSRRVAVEDVLQETFLEALERLDAYLARPELPLRLWLRLLAVQKIKTLYRFHVQARRRDPRREVPLRSDTGSFGGPGPVVAADVPTPSQVAIRSERQERFARALNDLGPVDREIVLLRHFERLPWADAARALSMRETAVRKRYGRVLRKLRSSLRPSGRDRSGTWW